MKSAASGRKGLSQNSAKKTNTRHSKVSGVCCILELYEDTRNTDRLYRIRERISTETFDGNGSIYPEG